MTPTLTRLFVAVLAFASSIASVQTVTAATMIDTTPGNLTATPFGEFNCATQGQTILAPLTDNVLTSFTFYLNDGLNYDFVDFQAYVYAWDNGFNRATGPALFASGPITTSNNSGADGMEEFAINTGFVPLTPGGTYVLFFSSSNLFDSFQGTAHWPIRTDNPYAGGTVVWSNNGNNFGQLTTTTWDGGSIAPGYDAAFKATFVAMPEPSTLAMSGIGLIGLAVYGWRRKRAPR